MMKGKKIFLILFGAVFLSLVGARSGYAAYDDTGCTTFSPAFVLCSVHSHNIGMTKDGVGTSPANPESAEQIADMNEVIAYKSTVIAQQLKKQYDALNSVIKRFKTQLEKAILTSKMELVTGTTSSSSGSSSYSSGGGNGTGLANAQDCDAVTDTALVYDCIIGNMQKIQSANDTRAAREQLKNDIAIANDLTLCYEADGKTRQKCDIEISTTAPLKDVKTKAIEFSRKLRAAKDTYNNNLYSNRYGRGG